MKRNRAPSLAIVTIIVSGLLLTGCHRHRSPDPERVGKKFEKHVEHVLSSIDATDEQKARIHSITDKMRQDVTSMYRDNSFHHESILEPLFSDQPDVTQLHRLVDDKSEQMNAFAHRILDHLLEINSVLTPEQRRELKQKYRKVHDKIKESMRQINQKRQDLCQKNLSELSDL